MKSILTIIILLLNYNLAIGQISPNDLQPLFESLNKENYNEVNQISNKLLKKFEKGNSPVLGLIRYANLFSSAVLVAEGKMKCKELKKIAKKFEGKSLMMAAHPTTTDLSQDVFKYNVLKKENGKVISNTKSSNNENTIVYIYEQFQFEEYFNINEFDKEDTRCRGKLVKSEINKKNSKDWIIRIYLEDSQIHKIN